MPAQAGAFDANGELSHSGEYGNLSKLVHVNTVSQRLERISALLGPHWQRPDDALELQLALARFRKDKLSMLALSVTVSTLW